MFHALKKSQVRTQDLAVPTRLIPAGALPGKSTKSAIKNINK
jgi:hypothetical protein